MSNATTIIWIVAAMRAWVPIASHSEAPATALERYVSLATDYVEVASSEEPLFPGPLGMERTIALLASVESYESQYAKGPIIDKPAHAYCGMQIETGRGVVLSGDVWRYARPGVDLDIIDGARLNADHALCVRVGLHMLRASLRRWKDLTEYTGEWRCKPTCSGVKAKQRMDRADRWLRLTKGKP